MTVIAFKDGILAGDSCWAANDDVVTLAPKVFRLRSGALYGAAGKSEDRDLMDKLQDVMSGAQLPDHKWLAEASEGVEAMLILPNGEIWDIDTSKKEQGAYRVNAAFFAIGSGRRHAMATMSRGFTAEQACWTACEFNLFCRPPIVTVTHDGAIKTYKTPR